MKKILPLVLALLIFLCACSQQDSSTNQSNEYFPANTNSNSTQSTQEDEPQADQPTGVRLDIRNGTVFSEDKAFVSLKEGEVEQYTGISAIDKEGNILFHLDENYHLCSSFYNGLAIVGLKNSSYTTYDVLCGTDGTIYTPESFGGTVFYNHLADELSSKLLADGFVIISNEDENTAGVLSTSFEWILPMSGDLCDPLNSVYNYDLYYNGYVIDSDRYFDLRNGKWETDFSALAVKKESDLYRLTEEGVVKDFRSKQECFTIPTERLSGNFDKFPFQNGYALLTDMERQENSEFVMRYYVVDDTGSFVITPTYKDSRLSNIIDDSVSLAEETLLLSYATAQMSYSRSGTKEVYPYTEFEARDLQGNQLGSYKITTPDSTDDTKYWVDSATIEMHDSVIAINYTVMAYHSKFEYQTSEAYTLYFTRDFKPLF